MYQREDGIVEFDARECIGCKGCMQACPYDAIYIDPETSTAAKCNFCSHRVDRGLEPACAVVCPEHAIIAGDMDDPSSEISRTLAANATTVRKPEQGTRPNVFYIEGSAIALHPTATEIPDTFMWADVVDDRKVAGGGAVAYSPPTSIVAVPTASLSLVGKTKKSAAGQPLRAPPPQGMPSGGPIRSGRGNMAEHMVQVSFNAQHKIPWHWPVPAYLVTKGIAAGVLGVLAVGLLAGLVEFHAATVVAAGGLSLLFTLVTTGLLVADLDRPERFLRILFRPQWRSWLTRGAFILVGFSVVSGLWWVLELAAWLGWASPSLAAAARTPSMVLMIPLALGTAIYTAFLFAQAEGRDLWQNSLLPVHLIVQAMMMGGAALALVAAVVDVPPAVATFALVSFAIGLGVDLLIMLLELGMSHASEVAAQAAHAITHGRYRTFFWAGSVGLGHILPFALVVSGSTALGALAALCSAAGLYFYEYAYVMAPQEIPNS